MSTARKPLALSAAMAAVAAPLLLASPASAATGTYDLSGDLDSLNDSGATATVSGTLEGNQLHLMIQSQGLLEGSPHAQHIHIGGASSCPGADADADGDGVITTPEAAENYGPIQVSLTTSGDYSPDSALAVDRFPVGSTTYERTVEVSDELAADIAAGHGVIVQHGVDLDGSGAYDGDVMSELDPSLPREATVPADCGMLNASMAMPSGGADTGVGGTADGGTDLGLLGAGLGLVALGAGAYGVRRYAVAHRG